MKILILFFSIVFSTAVIFPAHARTAGFAFKPAFMYYSNKISSNSTTGTTYQWVDLGLGYTTDMGIFIGALYHMPTITDHGATTDCTYQHTGWGPSIGYRGDSVYVIGTMFLDNKRSGCSVTYKGGSHYQIDAGYGFSISSSVEIAPQLTYYSYQYAENETSGTTLNPKVTYFGFIPLLALIINF